jgi:hypothetical protein
MEVQRRSATRVHLHRPSWRRLLAVSASKPFFLSFVILTYAFSMLAVMTLNVGYFLSVLAGLFVGELAVGRYAQMDDGHH